jgi:hypothetical protein
VIVTKVVFCDPSGVFEARAHPGPTSSRRRLTAGLGAEDIKAIEQAMREVPR